MCLKGSYLAIFGSEGRGEVIEELVNTTLTYEEVRYGFRRGGFVGCGR